METRIGEHQRRALYKHSFFLADQVIDYIIPAISVADNNSFRLQIKEALKKLRAWCLHIFKANAHSFRLDLW